MALLVSCRFPATSIIERFTGRSGISGTPSVGAGCEPPCCCGPHAPVPSSTAPAPAPTRNCRRLIRLRPLLDLSCIPLLSPAGPHQRLLGPPRFSSEQV